MKLHYSFFGILMSMASAIQASTTSHTDLSLVSKPWIIHRWVQNIDSCQENVTWPSIDTYKLTTRDYYIRAYMCVNNDGVGPEAILRTIESRDCTAAHFTATLGLYWACPDEAN